MSVVRSPPRDRAMTEIPEDQRGDDPHDRVTPPQPTDYLTAIPAEGYAAEFRNVRLPTFWKNRPKLWFVQLESELHVYRIRADEGLTP